MTVEGSLLIEAISSLKQEPTFLKDYIWPILTVFFSALLGAGTAFWTIKHQESIQIEKDKLDSVNYLIFTILQAQANLIAIKENYAKGINIENENYDSPIYRLLTIPKMLRNEKPIDYKLQSIFFIATNPSKNSESAKWRDIVRIFSMINNYNELLTIITKRSELHEKVLKIIAQHMQTMEIEANEIYRLIPHDLLKETIDLTERMIVLTDDLIIEMHSFLKEFPDLSRKSIKTKKIEHYGKLFSISEPPEQAIYLYQRCGEVNYSQLGKIFEEDENAVKQRYKQEQMTSEKEQF